MDFLIQPLSIIIMFVLKQRIINLPKGDLLFSNSSVLALVTAQKSARCIYIYIYIYSYVHQDLFPFEEPRGRLPFIFPHKNAVQKNRNFKT
jgi:hypothetical protein